MMKCSGIFYFTRAPLLLMGTALLVSPFFPISSADASAKNALQSAGDLGKINIRLTGNIVAPGCTVDPSDVSKAVSLGDWPTKQLHYPSGQSTPVAFSIHLMGCSANGVTLAFSGTKDKTDNTLLALNDNSTASGIAVEIMDAAHKRIAMGSDAQRMAVDSNGDAVLNFSARYVAVAHPCAGKAYADSEFMLTYD